MMMLFECCLKYTPTAEMQVNLRYKAVNKNRVFICSLFVTPGQVSFIYLQMVMVITGS